MKSNTTAGITEKIQAVFDENFIGVIATVNDDGSPWATPLHLASDRQAVYWFSDDKEIHSQNIIRDGRVSLSLPAPDGGAHKTGIYLNNRAERLDEDRWEPIRQLMIDRLGFDLSCFHTGAAYRLPIGELDKKKSSGNCWYFHNS